MKIISVAGAASDVGTSTVAANLATLIAQQGKDTLIIDLSLKANGISTALAIEEMVKTSNYADIENWEDGKVLITKKGVSVLAGSELFTEIDVAVVKNIIEYYSNKYEFIFLDLGQFHHGITDIVSLSDEVYLVTEPNYKSIANTNIIDRPYKLIVNKVSKNSIYHPRDIMRSYNAEVNFEIGEDIAAVKKSLQKRTLLVYCSKKVQRQYEKIMIDIIGDLPSEKGKLPWLKSNKKVNVENQNSHNSNYQNLSINGGTDYLTGCLTREALDNLNKGQESIYTVLFCDLDNFKLINDTYGHDIGDEILSSFGEYLLNSTRRSDYVVRYGGDEFVVILNNTKINDARVLAEKICSAWNGKTFSSIGNKPVLFSGGLAQNKLHGSSTKEVLKAADKALYRVKRSGRGRVESATTIKNVKAKQIEIPPDAPVVIVCGDETEMLVGYMQKKPKRQLTVINTDPDGTKLAFMLGVDPNELWRYDWRLGLNTSPYKVSKRVFLYGMDRDYNDIEDRDIRALMDIINQNLKSGRVIIYAGNNLDILSVLERRLNNAKVIGRDNIAAG